MLEHHKKKMRKTSEKAKNVQTSLFTAHPMTRLWLTQTLRLCENERKTNENHNEEPIHSVHILTNLILLTLTKIIARQLFFIGT